MDWDAVGRDSLAAARELQNSRPRSAVCRSYYAAHAVLASVLVAAGYVPGANRQTPPHEAQAKLIGLHLAARGQRFVRELRTIVRRLYVARIDADYDRRTTVDRSVAKRAVRDAHVVFLMLGVTP